MWTSSRTWVSPRIKENAARQQLNHHRRKVCIKSPFWHSDFDLEKHRKEWEVGRIRVAEQKRAQELEVVKEKQRLQGTDSPTTPPIRTPFAGKEFETHHSGVLCQETVFCPQWQKGKANISPWPNKSEMKYEGDDRISTDRLHARFPGLPRLAGNETVNWQHRAPIEQYPFEEYYYPIPDPVEIFLRTHWVQELEFTDEEGEQALGKDFMDMLDPKDQ